ncbi:hypothetical protein HY837_03445, partial [archaeon]|nr:hypothetical protein [archaeon]
MEYQNKKNNQPLNEEDKSVKAFDGLESLVEKQVKKSLFNKMKEFPGKIKDSIVDSSSEGLSVLPKVGGWSLASWFLGIGSIFARYGGWNLGYNIAAGSGLAGGFSGSRKQKIVTGVTLAASMTPDI